MARYSRVATEDDPPPCCQDTDPTCCSTSTRPQVIELAQDLAPDTNSAVQLQDLPGGLIDKILDQLPPDSLLDAACVCRDWQQTVHTDKYKKVRVAWFCKSFLQPGLVASFRTRPQVLSFSSQRRLQHFREGIGKAMMLQV